jgi:NADPH:quinone reductase-like Zn-dependent oxidoreductase
VLFAGVDVVLDTVGGAGFEQALKSVRWGAHVLIIGFASGDVPKVPANIALVKNLTVSADACNYVCAAAPDGQANT